MRRARAAANDPECHGGQDAPDRSQAALGGRGALVAAVRLPGQYADSRLLCGSSRSSHWLILVTKLKGRAQLVSCVHDEIIVECDEADAEAIMAEVQEIMMTRSAQIFDGQKIGVEAHVEDNWAGLRVPTRSTELVLAA